MPKANGLSLHLPAPRVRPGHAPRFSEIKITKAGEIRRPDVNANPHEIRNLAFIVTRMLLKNHDAVGPRAYSLNNDELIIALRHKTISQPQLTLIQRSAKIFTKYVWQSHAMACICKWQFARPVTFIQIRNNYDSTSL